MLGSGLVNYRFFYNETRSLDLGHVFQQGRGSNKFYYYCGLVSTCTSYIKALI